VGAQLARMAHFGLPVFFFALTREWRRFSQGPAFLENGTAGLFNAAKSTLAMFSETNLVYTVVRAKAVAPTTNALR
jgi:hypothetical protein